ncbi:MAG: preprotein translocase subunit SecE [Clostridia bacterium]|nr:preprotein translocase subunit SecE [Clostridia bacterium]
MAKHKYQKKNVESVVETPDVKESVVSDADNSSDTTVIMTKKAKRRAKAASTLSSVSTPEKGKSKVVTSEQYKSIATTKRPVQKNTSNKRKGIEEKNSAGKRLAAWFRGMKAEMKAVTWPPFKSTSKVTGVWSNIGTVLLVVFFFLIVVTAFDSGLTSLFRLLVGIGN